MAIEQIMNNKTEYSGFPVALVERIDGDVNILAFFDNWKNAEECCDMMTAKHLDRSFSVFDYWFCRITVKVALKQWASPEPTKNLPVRYTSKRVGM